MKKLRTNSNAYLLNTRISGDGPVIVLLHGFLASSQYWERSRTLLEKEYTVIAIDLLGFGKSPKPYLSRYDYGAHMASIKLTLETLSMTQPFTLVGHSMGSLIALRFANTYPEKIDRLLLTNMPIMLTPEEVKREIYRSKVARYGLHPVAQYFMWGTFKSVTRLRLIPKQVKMVLGERRNYMFQHSGVSRVRSFRNVIVDGSVEDDLKKVSVSTTLLSGIQDRKIYMQNMMNLVLPKTVAHQVVDSTHHIPILMPELVAKLLRDNK